MNVYLRKQCSLILSAHLSELLPLYETLKSWQFVHVEAKAYIHLVTCMFDKYKQRCEKELEDGDWQACIRCIWYIQKIGDDMKTIFRRLIRNQQLFTNNVQYITPRNGKLPDLVHIIPPNAPHSIPVLNPLVRCQRKNLKLEA